MDRTGSELTKLDNEEVTEKNEETSSLSTDVETNAKSDQRSSTDNADATQDDHVPKSLLTLLDSKERNEMRLVLIGKTGAGKSATGNTILGQKGYFESKISGKSVTSSCLKGERRLNNKIISIVDTPGIFDTSDESKTISQEIVKCVNMSLPGPHAFLLIVQAGRFTKEESQTFGELFDLFGYHMERFVIVVFTRLDDIEEENSTIDDYVKSATPELQSFLKKCNNKYFAINNRAGKEAKDNATLELMRIVDEITESNGGQHYTNKMYMEATEQLRKKILEAEKMKEEEKREFEEKIKSKFRDEIQEVKEKNKELEKQIIEQEMLKLQIQAEQNKCEREIHRMQAEIYQARTDTERQQKELEHKFKIEQAEVLKEQERQKEELIETMLQQQKEANDKYMEMTREKDEHLRKVNENQMAQQDQLNDILKSHRDEIQSLTAQVKWTENETSQLHHEMLAQSTQMFVLLIRKEAETSDLREQMLMQSRKMESVIAENSELKNKSSCVVM